jgi:hypothetical protein
MLQDRICGLTHSTPRTACLQHESRCIFTTTVNEFTCTAISRLLSAIFDLGKHHSVYPISGKQGRAVHRESPHRDLRQETHPFAKPGVARHSTMEDMLQLIQNLCLVLYIPVCRLQSDKIAKAHCPVPQLGSWASKSKKPPWAMA